jgi:hypothetical protein
MTDSTHIFIPKIVPTHFLCRNLLPLKLKECILAFMCLQFKTESCHQNQFKVHVPIIKDLMVEDAEEGSHIAKIVFMELLSYAFISKCYVVKVMDIIYEGFDLMKWISGCGFVSGTLMFKQGDIKPSRFILTLSGVILKFPLKDHPSSWLSEFNIQGGHSDDHDKLECENNGYTYPGGENDVVWTTKMARLVFLYCFVISRVADFDTYKEFLVGNVVIVPWNLMEFQKHLANVWAIPSHNGIFTLLINFGVLRNLSGVKTIQEFMVNDGLMSMFIMLMKPKEETSQVFSSKYLQNIDSADELIWQMLNLFYSSSCTSNILTGFDFVNHLLAIIMTFKLCETSKEVKMMSQTLHVMCSGLKSCISFHDKFGVTVLAAILSSKYVIAIRQFGHHIENTSQSVGQYFSTSDSRLAGVEWMGDKLYWEALQLKLHYDMDNIGLSMIVFTQIIVIGCHNNVHISTGLIACQLFRATLGTSLDLEIMIHDGIWINFPTSPCVVMIVPLIVTAKELYTTTSLIPTYRELTFDTIFAAIWQL